MIDPRIRYEQKVDRSKGDDACHPWTASVCKRGYGQLNVGGRKVQAHRWIYKQHHPDLRDDEVVRHSCDTPSCQNLKHLVKGTQADNMKDMQERRRSVKKTHCKRKHDLSLTGFEREDRPGQRECIECVNFHSREYYRRTGGRGRR